MPGNSATLAQNRPACRHNVHIEFFRNTLVGIGILCLRNLYRRLRFHFLAFGVVDCVSEVRSAVRPGTRYRGLFVSQPLKADVHEADVGSASTTTSASGFTKIKWAIDQARRELLDPSRRNQLLHAPLTGKRPSCMAVVGHDPDELFYSLCRQDNFRGYAFDAVAESNEQSHVR